MTKKVMAGDIPVYCSHDELVDVVKIVGNPRNPNMHDDNQIELLARIIKEQGWRKPITVSNRSGFVVSGHGRLAAAIKLKATVVPVDYQDYATEADEWADLIADNRIAEFSTIDEDMLSDLLAEINETDFDLSLTGYSIDEFEELFNDIDLDNTEEAAVVEDEYDAELPEEPKAKYGDIYQLGNHRLMCGDSTSIDDVEKLMNGNKADMVFTDPPYNVSFNGRSGNFDVIKNDNLSDEDFNIFINKTTEIIKRLNPSIYYIWCNWKFYGILQEKLKFKNCVVWAKNVFGLGKGYRHQHEFCLFNGEIDKEITDESDLWEISKDSNYLHPTQKPVALCGRALKNHKKVNNVLDLFGGSGSTLIACEQLSRQCYMMELDPKYIDVIISRWEQFTGQKAVLLERNN